MKLLLERGSDPSLANDKELTPLDVCTDENIRKLLVNAHQHAKPSKNRQHGDNRELLTQDGAAKKKQLETAFETEPKMNEGMDEGEDDSAFVADSLSSISPLSSKPPARFCATSSHQLPPETTPSRTRRQGKREGSAFSLVGRIFSDMSSSESDSELLETAKKVGEKDGRGEAREDVGEGAGEREKSGSMDGGDGARGTENIKEMREMEKEQKTVALEMVKEKEEKCKITPDKEIEIKDESRVKPTSDDAKSKLHFVKIIRMHSIMKSTKVQTLGTCVQQLTYCYSVLVSVSS